MSNFSIFVGYNYSDSKLDTFYGNFKKEIENEYPCEVVIYKKQGHVTADEFWNKIKDYIAVSNLSIFDVSANKANVILELGFALGRKDNEQIAIAFNIRKSKGVTPKFQLTNIGHLQRIDYTETGLLKVELKKAIRQIMPYFELIENTIHKITSDDLKKACIKTLSTINKVGNIRITEIRRITSGLAVDEDEVVNELKKQKLIKKYKTDANKFIFK